LIINYFIVKQNTILRLGQITLLFVYELTSFFMCTFWNKFYIKICDISNHFFGIKL